MAARYSIWNNYLQKWHLDSNNKRLVTEDVNLVLDAYLELKERGFKSIEIKRVDDERTD